LAVRIAVSVPARRRDRSMARRRRAGGANSRIPSRRIGTRQPAKHSKTTPDTDRSHTSRSTPPPADVDQRRKTAATEAAAVHRSLDSGLRLRRTDFYHGSVDVLDMTDPGPEGPWCMRRTMTVI